LTARRSIVVRWGAAITASALLTGCQTARSFDQGCPGIYSGVRYYGDQVGELPADGKLFFSLDLPLSALLDTLLLPVTPFLEPKKPPFGWPAGCRWVVR
jgi:uncharacterized protein YceK